MYAKLKVSFFVKANTFINKICLTLSMLGKNFSRRQFNFLFFFFFFFLVIFPRKQTLTFDIKFA